MTSQVAPGPRLEPSLGDLSNPYLAGLYAPIDEEREVGHEDLTVHGEIPTDLHGVYVRNGPNPRMEARGRYHWFDGDGMVHAVRFEDGRASYRNRYVVTEAFEREAEAGDALWTGLLEPRTGNPEDAPEKDTANTDVIAHNGKLLSLWYRSGAPYALDPLTLETRGREDFGATLSCDVSAHAKVDERTGELFFFDFGEQAPYLRYGVVGPEGRVEHMVDVEAPGPRLPHDMAITQNHAILMDLPLVNDPEAAKAGRYKLEFHRDWPSRFAILPRRGGPAQVRWFEAEPTYIYHVVNSWEEDDRIVMIVCRITNGAPRMPAPGPLGTMLAALRPDAVLHRYTFDLTTGRTTEEQLDDAVSEFPAINQRFCGYPNQVGYIMNIADEDTMLHDGLWRYDLSDGTSTAYWFGEGRWGTEAAFAPRPGATDETDGYLILYVTDAATRRTSVEILDGADIAAGPVCRIDLPLRIPLGFHATWVGAERLVGN